MQHCGLASEAVVLWDDCVMHWNPIGVAAVFLLRYCRVHLNSLSLFRDVENVRDLYITFSPFVPGATFFHLLNTARRYNATDARDKVFALVSHPTATTISYAAPHNASAFEPYIELVTHFLPRPEDKYLIRKLAQKRHVSSTETANRPEPLLKADYSKTFEEVYRNLAWDHIKRTKTLEILTAVQHDPKRAHLISSVPAGYHVGITLLIRQSWDFMVAAILSRRIDLLLLHLLRSKIQAPSPCVGLCSPGSYITRIFSVLQISTFPYPAQILWDRNLLSSNSFGRVTQ